MTMAPAYTILLVDDDPRVLEVIGRILGDTRHVVLTATNGYEAVRVLVERWVDLMITDVRMPGLNGIALAEQAKLLCPNLHIMYLSAYAEDVMQGDVRLLGKFLEKPIRMEPLLEEIERELGG